MCLQVPEEKLPFQGSIAFLPLLLPPPGTNSLFMLIFLNKFAMLSILPLYGHPSTLVHSLLRQHLIFGDVIIHIFSPCWSTQTRSCSVQGMVGRNRNWCSNPRAFFSTNSPFICESREERLVSLFVSWCAGCWALVNSKFEELDSYAAWVDRMSWYYDQIGPWLWK